MKIPANILGAKHILLAIFVSQGLPAIAQSSVPPFISQQFEVSAVARDVCEIDPDSRQCELMQFLLVKNSPATSQGDFLPIDPKTPPRMLEYLIYKSKEKQSLISSMELDGKMQASRMYRVLHTGRDKICGIKQESFPCMRILMSFVYQADVEAGDSLNMPANIPADIKQSVRKLIAKEHPDAYPSTRLLLEATILSKMQEDNDVSSSSTPVPASKEKERKGRGVCANNYSPSYDPQKCR